MNLSIGFTKTFNFFVSIVSNFQSALDVILLTIKKFSKSVESSVPRIILDTAYCNLFHLKINTRLSCFSIHYIVHIQVFYYFVFELLRKCSIKWMVRYSYFIDERSARFSFNSIYYNILRLLRVLTSMLFYYGETVSFNKKFTIPYEFFIFTNVDACRLFSLEG